MKPTLYIIMRNDLDSLNPGKAMAQASHATNQFERMRLSSSEEEDVHEWREDRDFGTCIVLAGTGSQIEEIDRLAGNSDFLHDAVVDPTYPVKDGQVVHHVPLMTCGWIFVHPRVLESKEPLAETYYNNKVFSKIRGLDLYR